MESKALGKALYGKNNTWLRQENKEKNFIIEEQKVQGYIPKIDIEL